MKLRSLMQLENGKNLLQNWQYFVKCLMGIMPLVYRLA